MPCIGPLQILRRSSSAAWEERVLSVCVDSSRRRQTHCRHRHHGPPSPTSSVLEAAINSLFGTELYCLKTGSEYFLFFRALFCDAAIMVLDYTCLQNRGKFRSDRCNGWDMNRRSVISRYQFYKVHKCERSKSSLKRVLPTTSRSLL
jgi:hypothetical protein